MNFIKNLHNYFNDNDSLINIWNNSIYLKNYLKIDKMSKSIIIINYHNTKIHIIGTDLVIKKLLNKEVLIKGVLKKIEFINE